MGLQKSAYSNGNEVQFTANVLVASKSVWAQMRAQQSHLPDRPTPTTFYGHGVSQRRIGELLPGEADTWWRVYDGVDLEAVADEVVTSIKTHVLPWMREQLGAAHRAVL
jgi:hypothetical protein